MKYGLALSGGGTRGAAHAGVLLALEEAALLPDSIAGTSAGSIVAGLYASGCSPADIRDMVLFLTKYGAAFLDPDCINILKLIPQIITRRPVSLSGIIKGNRLLEYLCDETEGMMIKDAIIPLVIPAADLNTGNTIAFTNSQHPSALPGVIWDKDVRLCDAMMASSSVPGVFQPRYISSAETEAGHIRQQTYSLVDGGVTNNLPVDLLIASGTSCVIAVDIGVDYQTPHSDNIIEVVSHSFSIMSHTLKDCQASGEILVLSPELPKGAGLLTFPHMKACMEAGYQYTKHMIPVIRRQITACLQKEPSRDG